MRRSILLSIVMILSLSVNLSWAKEPKEFTQQFFAKIEAGKINEAYDGLFAGSRIPEMKPQAVEMLKRQTSSGLPLYGKIMGSEMVLEEAFGTAVVRLVYVLKLELAPTVWQFFFYKPKDQWFLGHVIFNDQFQNLAKMK